MLDFYLEDPLDWSIPEISLGNAIEQSLHFLVV